MERVRNTLDKMVLYITPLLPFVNAHMVNFVTHNLWDIHIPRGMSKEFSEGQTACDILSLLFEEDREDVTDFKYPEFRSFVSEARSMSQIFEDGIALPLDDFIEKLWKLNSERFNVLRYEQFMSSKKSHEVEMMSYLTAVLTHLTEVTHVVDVGGGKGYLSSILSLEYKLKVLGLDSCSTKTSGAATRANKLKKYWPSTRIKIGPGKLSSKCSDAEKSSTVTGTIQTEAIYKQQTEFVTEETNLSNVVVRAFPDDNEFRLGLVGLHTCGNLSPICINQFIKNSYIQYLVNVGCCYHLLEEDVSSSECGFPLSNFLKEREFSLGRNGRMLSLQAQARINSTKSVPVDSLMYRAVLQQLLVEKLGYDNVPKGQIGRLSKKCSNFKEYVQKGLSKLKLSNVKITDEEAEEFYSKFENLRSQLLIFFMLRVSLAPVLESIILLDRLLYLWEQDLQQSYLIRMFDPVLSPRCYGIVAIRN